MYNKVVVSQDSTTRINTFVLKPCIALITFFIIKFYKTVAVSHS